MFTLSVAQLMIQIYVQMKQDLINVNNAFFPFCYYCLYLTFILTDLHIKKKKIFFYHPLCLLLPISLHFNGCLLALKMFNTFPLPLYCS